LISKPKFDLARLQNAIPVALFAYARPKHLTQTLACLRENDVSLIYAFSDGPRAEDKAQLVEQVREILHGIDWCKVVICERATNLGLGKSLLAGVTEVLSTHNMCIVFEDDLICVPGTYNYLSEALWHYRNDSRVMSVTGWTHPLVAPKDISDNPYFDGRAECWVWGTWARAWKGMDASANELIKRCKNLGIDPYCYGGDLVQMANQEKFRNIWAVRMLYWHILNKGLCLRPPWSMVEHIGFDSDATNASNGNVWRNPPLRSRPPVPQEWPEPEEHPECRSIWQCVCGSRTSRRSILSSMLRRFYRGFRVSARMTDSGS